MEKIVRRCGVGESGSNREAFAPHSLMSKVGFGAFVWWWSIFQFESKDIFSLNQKMFSVFESCYR
jgi:hypothetical protein